jgi:hypothetical protein
MNNDVIERLAKCESRINDLIESAEEMAPRLDKLNLIRERIISLKNAAIFMQDEPEYMASDIEVSDSLCKAVGDYSVDAMRFCDEFIDDVSESDIFFTHDDLHQMRMVRLCERNIRILSAIMLAQLAGYRDYIIKKQQC